LVPLTAGEWDKSTKVTFGQAVELPGFTLQPGTYTFKLADLPGSRHVVQVFNAEGNHIYGMILAIPNLKLKATSDTVLRFEERPSNRPQALRAWFYPGDTWGQEFVYPRAEATEIAASAHVAVLSAPVTPTEKAEVLVKEPVIAVTPENKEVEVAQVVEAPPVEIAQAAPAAAPAAPAELPKTGSIVPTVGLLGLAGLLLGGVLRRLARAA
jgi:LPXTG-motif cell wall-anchored protein